MSIATQTGDTGHTRLVGGRRISKGDARVVVRLVDDGERIDRSVIVYLNRLADLLWLLGRLIERDQGVDAASRRPEDGGSRWSKAWP